MRQVLGARAFAPRAAESSRAERILGTSRQAVGDARPDRGDVPVRVDGTDLACEPVVEENRPRLRVVLLQTLRQGSLCIIRPLPSSDYR